MKFSKLWLEELLNFNISTEKLTEQLTMVGLEVAAVKSVASEFSKIVIGEVLEVKPHPNADRLTICTVRIGDRDHSLNIVCGATNVKPKLKVPVALIGAKLPNSCTIKKTILRGIESSGMLCSAEELDLPRTNSGILELPCDAPIGTDIRQYLSLNDEVIEIELTSNRGDCLSMFGIAREVAAINRITFSPPIVKAQNVHVSSDVFPVIIKAKDACPHYCGCVIRGVNNKISTPIWMQERLRRLGVQSINFIVDVTNYVMLELGQPLHAFDLAKLNKRIEVRYANLGESIKLLDGCNVDLNGKTLVIADNDKVLAIAGIMGGLDVGISLETKYIFLESAFFAPEKIVEQANALRLQTDSSYRFARGVDPELQLHAINRAAALIVEISQGKIGMVSEVISKDHLPKRCNIILHRNNVASVLGIAIPDEEIVGILSHLGVILKPINVGWQATIPSWRVFDIKIEEDLIEEIARIYGYSSITEQKIIVELDSKEVDSNKQDIDRICCLMEDLGYREVITYSFINEKLQNLLLGDDSKVLYLANPISSDETVMRATLWPGLINVVKYNSRRQEQYMRLFEVGLRFIPRENESLEQGVALAGIIYGDLYPEQWGIRQKKSVDFFDLKNDVNNILKLYADEDDIKYVYQTHKALHSKRSAQVYVCGKEIGFIGEIHPLVKQKLGLDRVVHVFEINLYNLINRLHESFKRFSIFPRITRDIAIIVNKEISWAQIKQKIIDISGELLQNASVFDVYCSENIGLDKHSLAIRLTFQSIERTLVDVEVESLMDHIILVLKQSVGAILRG